MTNPFRAKLLQWIYGGFELRYFSQCTPIDYVREVAQRYQRFRQIEPHMSFHRFPRGDDAVQFDFGSRMLRPKSATAFASEKGATLLYALGPTGDFAVVLFPCSSELYKGPEDFIVLRTGRYGALRMLALLPGDLKDLVTYCYVTSLDGSPTFLERLRVIWLRWTRRRNVAGVPRGASAVDFTANTVGSIAKEGALAAGRIFWATVGVGIVVALVATFNPEWAVKLSGWANTSSR